MEKLLKALEHISPLGSKSQQCFLDAWQYISVPKDFTLLRENTVSDYFFFLDKGLARIYYYKNEKEITEWLATDQQFFLSITSFFERGPSHLIMHTLQPSQLYKIHHDDFMRLADEHHDVERLLRKMVTSSLILSQVRMDSIQFETAQQRYERLLRTSPQLIQRVPLSYIASFLGVTLETLSRIRSQK
ncbi:MAG: hypothetical protein RL172_3090 [Bacteroidota bacterium]